MSARVRSGGLPVARKKGIATSTKITIMISAGSRRVRSANMLAWRSGDMARVFDPWVFNPCHQPADPVAGSRFARHDAHQAAVEQNRNPVGILQKIVEVFRHPQHRASA